MYKCNFCGNECKTIQGLISHKRLKHGIVKKKAAVQDEIERKLATEELIVQPEEYYEELLKEREELQTRLLQYAEPSGNEVVKHIRNEIEAVRERVYHVNEEKGTDETSEMGPPAFPPLPPLFPILPPPFAETLSEKIKKLSERELFR